MVLLERYYLRMPGFRCLVTRPIKSLYPVKPDTGFFVIYYITSALLSNYIIPPIPPIPPPGGIGISSFSLGFSAIMASVVSRSEETEAAF
jgi:hypothetical protein